RERNLVRYVSVERNRCYVRSKAPHVHVGLEPTTLRLTEGFQVVAGSCGLLPTHSWFCIYRFWRVAVVRSRLLRFAGCCVFKRAKKRQAVSLVFMISSRISTNSSFKR